MRWAGYKNFLTKIRSEVLLRTGVMEIGRKVSMLGRGRDLRNRLNSCKFPLMGDSRSRDRQVNYKNVHFALL